MSRKFQKTAVCCLWTKAMLLLNPFIAGILWKISKKTRNAILNGSISKARTNSESKLTFSGSSFSFLWNRVVFLHGLLTWVHCRGVHARHPRVLLPTSWRAERVNDKPVKVLNLLFFISFLWKWAESFEKLHFFAFGPKQCFYLTHTAREYFEKLAFKKNKKRNFKRLYLKS